MNSKYIIGLDEAGRGPLAGPVVAGCVLLLDDFPIEILNDSKKLSEKKRNFAESMIKEKACWGIGLADHYEIDKINILNASLLAMQRAYDNMMEKLAEWCKSIRMDCIDKQDLNAIVDGTFCPDISCNVKSEPKADGKYPSVMAASIIAKTYRDRLMIEYDKLYPEYGYAKHKGYPTKQHMEICRKIGPSPIQRMTFKIK
ncbi:MAG: ribonuclease HII [Treponema sp.]|nr:ribonuclease HII [Treponema sp.]